MIAQGDTKVSVTLQSGINADLRMVTADEFPYALHHFTGSREHNTAMRGRAKDLGLKMNEYGLFRGERKCRLPLPRKEIFATLGLQYIDPELRENMGEIEAAERERIAQLIEEGTSGAFSMCIRISATVTDSLENMARRPENNGVSIYRHQRSQPFRFLRRWFETRRIFQNSMPPSTSSTRSLPRFTFSKGSNRTLVRMVALIMMRKSWPGLTL